MNFKQKVRFVMFKLEVIYILFFYSNSYPCFFHTALLISKLEMSRINSTEVSCSQNFTPAAYISIKLEFVEACLSLVFVLLDLLDSPNSVFFGAADLANLQLLVWERFD